MNSKTELKIRRYIELEEYLKKLLSEERTIRELSLILFEEIDDLDDIEYLMDAYFLPIEEIDNELKNYDSKSLLNKSDEIQFIQQLSDKYGVDRSKIIKRIKDIRRINKIKVTFSKIKKKKKTKKTVV